MLLLLQPLLPWVSFAISAFSYNHLDMFMNYQIARLMNLIWGPDRVMHGYRVGYWMEYYKSTMQWMHQKLALYIYVSMGVGLCVGGVLFYLWKNQGIKAHDKKTISGSEFADKKVVIKKIR